MTPAPASISRSTLTLHIAGAALVQSTSLAAQAVLPILAIKKFGANEWQSLLLTATPTILYSLSIFWGDLLKRRPFGRYLLIFWLVACLPLAFIAFATNYWMLLVPHLISCIGGAAYPPLNGELLQALYPAARRGRTYSILWGCWAVVTAILGFGLGWWMARDDESFRVFLPVLVVLQAGGVAIFHWLAVRSGHDARRLIEPETQGGRWARLSEPVRHMGRLLKADPVFARYEGAYMTYGVGWMIVYALLPILVTQRLGLNYDEIALSTQSAYLLALVAVLYPAGLLLDRIGAIRSTGISFFLLMFYPLGLLLVRQGHTTDLAIVSAFYGVAHAGASVGWTLGPVSLAPTPDKVPAYMAIHATLVGLRGKVFQGLGVLLFWATGSFAVPLVLAAAAHLWSAVQMWQLDKKVRSPKS